MSRVLHITGGDSAGGSLAKAGLPGDVFVWHDILYEGPRDPGWPDRDTLRARARFLVQATGGGVEEDRTLGMLERQYGRLETAAQAAQIVLWFDACLFDQAMLSHVLVCLHCKGARQVDLLCVDAFPGIVPFDGLGQLQPEQLASVYDERRPVTAEQLDFAATVDRAFALQDPAAFVELVGMDGAPLPWVPAAVARWLQEQPDPGTGLGRLEQLALDAIRAGREAPGEIFAAVAANDTHPQFWGDTTLWAKINALADRDPPLARIDGPAPRLPLWEGMSDPKLFRIVAEL